MLHCMVFQLAGSWAYFTTTGVGVGLWSPALVQDLSTSQKNLWNRGHEGRTANDNWKLVELALTKSCGSKLGKKGRIGPFFNQERCQNNVTAPHLRPSGSNGETYYLLNKIMSLV